jgi:hypothetical protein
LAYQDQVCEIEHELLRPRSVAKALARHDFWSRLDQVASNARGRPRAATRYSSVGYRQQMFSEKTFATPLCAVRNEIQRRTRVLVSGREKLLASRAIPHVLTTSQTKGLRPKRKNLLRAFRYTHVPSHEGTLLSTDTGICTVDTLLCLAFSENQFCPSFSNHQSHAQLYRAFSDTLPCQPAMPMPMPIPYSAMHSPSAASTLPRGAVL